MIPALVLAAGRSSRMGRAKATLPLDGGDSFLTRIVRTFLDAHYGQAPEPFGGPAQPGT